MAIVTTQRKPTGAITQIDPGLYKDASGGYFTGTSVDNAVYQGDDLTKAMGTSRQPTPTSTTQPAPRPPSDASGRSVDPYGGLPNPNDLFVNGQPRGSNPGTPWAPTDNTQLPTLPGQQPGINHAYSAQTGADDFSKQIAAWYQQFLGRTPNADEIAAHRGNPAGPDGVYGVISRSPEAAAYAARAGNTNTSNPYGWIDDALRTAQSTDDPNYWYGKIQADPKAAAGDQSAIGYWKDRIARGDGALAVRNGTMAKFNDGGAGPSVQSGPRTLPGYTSLSPTQSGTAQDAVGYLNGISHSMGGGDLSQEELAKYAAMVGYKEGQPVTGAMINQIASAMMQGRGYAAPGSGSTTPPGGGAYSPTNPFDDPATKNYIDLLNTRIQELLKPRQDPSLDAFMKMISDRSSALNTPYNNPDAAPLQDWMRKYFQQLQGPAYTPEQQAILQTQALDPMEHQRQAELKNVATQMASRGITPGSGPYQQMERDINQKYDALRAQTQAGLSVNEINQGRQNQAQAANVGGQLAQFTQGQFQNNENRANDAVSLFGTIPQLNLQQFQAQDARANQAVGLARQIPDLAQARLAQSISMLNGSNVNPASLISSLQGFQQQGMNQNSQDSAYWQSIIAALAKAFGL